MNHDVKASIDGVRILPSDHGDGVPWCSHLVCPAYTEATEGDFEGFHLGVYIPPDPARCSCLPGPPTVVCVPAVRVIAARAKKLTELATCECGQSRSVLGLCATCDNDE